MHGSGVFAGEDFCEGEVLWRYAPDLDRLIRFEDIPGYPKAFQDYLEMYAYTSPQVPGGVILSCDHAKFLNHSDEPNTVIEGETTLARRMIRKGEEITCDYRICVAGFTGFD